MLLKGIMNGKNYLLKEAVRAMNTSNISPWAQSNHKYKNIVGLNDEQLKDIPIESIKRKVNEWDTKQWQEEMASKSSIEIYRAARKEIGNQDHVYDNRPSSIILFKCRSNTLPLSDRNRFKNEATECKLCEAPIETLHHFLLDCPAYSDLREKIAELQQPYPENKNKVIVELIFNNNNIESKKEEIYKIWRRRDRLLKELQ